MTPKKYPQNLHTQKNIYFSENPKNIEIQNFEPKNDLSLRIYEISEYPPSPREHIASDLCSHPNGARAYCWTMTAKNFSAQAS